MNVTSSKTEKRTAYLTIEMEPAEVEEYLESAYKRMVDKVDIPGFRKGNAPREVLEKHVGRDKLLEEANKELMSRTCSRAIKEQGLKPLTQPMVKVIQEEPLVFEMVVPLVPVVEIGDYHSIRMQPEPVKITDKDINKILEQIRQQYATHEPVDRPVKTGDIITINIEGIVLESPIIKGNGVQLKILPEFPPEIPGLSDHFIGMKKDEEKEFKLNLPENYPNKLVANKEALFKAKVLEVKEEKLPKLDDNLVKMIAPDITTLDALRERIAKNTKVDYEQKANIKFEEKLVATLIEKSNLEIPPLMIESEAKYLIEQGLQELQSSCKNKEEYEKKLKQIPMEQVKEQYQAMAERRVNWNLALDGVARAENIEVSDDEIAEEIEFFLQSVTGKEKDTQRQYLNEPQNYENVRNMVSARKTIQLLTEIATSPDKKEKKKRKEAK
ncbi:trigger factor [Chloroflexota bacterium]